VTAIPHLVSTYFPQPRISPVGEGWRHFGRFREAKSLNYYGTNPGRSSTSGVFERGIGCKSLYQAPQALRLSRRGSRLLVWRLPIYRWPTRARRGSV